MEIPSKLNAYEKPTLLVVSSHDTARPFMIEDRNVKELEKIHTEDTEYEYSDKEGYSYVGNQTSKGEGTVPGNVEKNEMHYNKVFVNYLVERIQNIYKKHKPETVLMTMPSKLKKLVKDKLPQEILKRLEVVNANYINMPIPEILEALDGRSTAQA